MAVWAQTAYKPVTQKLSREPVEQPLPFSHKAHVALGMKRRDCHAIPDPGFAAGYPAEATCMACHAAIKTENSRMEKPAEFDRFTRRQTRGDRTVRYTEIERWFGRNLGEAMARNRCAK